MAEFKSTLNPAIWDKNNNNLKPEVKAKLNQIAKAFIETLEVPANAVQDIVITGSMASYNYTPHSDIDLHLIIDFEKVHTDCPIVGDYLLSKKSEFNQKHDIFIYGIPVEVYAEGVGQGTVHNGLYSLKTGWIDLPKKIKPTNNDVAVEAKYKEYKEAADSIKDGDLAEKLLDKIKKMRKAGLAEGGEFSVENLVFKKLRDTGVIEKLMKVKKEGIDKKLSLGETFEVVEAILEAWGNNSGRYANGADGLHDSSSDDDYYVKKYKIAYHDREMTPQQYIDRATRLNNKSQGLKYSPKQIEKDRRSYENNYSMKDLSDKIQSKTKKIDRPYLDYHRGDQEGLHRAIAAKDAGIEKIPVRVFHSTEKGGNRISKKNQRGANNLGEEFIKSLSESVSEGCYNDIVGLVEEIINEFKDGVYRRGHDIAAAIAKEQEGNLGNVKKAEDIEFVKDDIAKRRHQAAKMCDRRESQVVNREREKYEQSKKKID